MRIIENIRIGYVVEDDARSRRRKTMSVLVILLVCFATIMFSIDPSRSIHFRVLDTIAISGELLSLYVLHRTKSVKALFWTMGPPLIAVQFLFLLMNGNTEGDILAFLLAPVAAVVVFGPEQSRPWFWVCFLAVIAVVLSGENLPNWSTSLAVTDSNPLGSIFNHPQKRALEFGEGLAMAVGGICVYLLVYSVYKQLQSASDVIADQKTELEREHERSEKLLSNILPASVAQRLKEEPDKTISDDLADVTVLFADIVGFTAMSAKHSAPMTVTLLNLIFSQFDALVDKHGLEKIKTIGDAYMVVGGAPEPMENHANAVARLALDMQTQILAISVETGEELSVRIGIASGPATAGVIGTRKPFYDIWGDTVNLASRMESTGVAGKVQIAESTKVLLGIEFTCDDRGIVEIKGKGKTKVWILKG